MEAFRAMDAARPEVRVVTGAAAGIGAAVAARLAERGGALLLCDLDDAALDASASACAGRAGIERLAGDVASPGFAPDLLAALEGRRIAALVHCAGVSAAMADPARILDVNLAGTLRLVDAIRPHMAAGGAAVLLASSGGHYLGDRLDPVLRRATRPDDVAALRAYAATPQRAYSMSKRAVQLLARREAAAFGRIGARIVSLSPGVVDTRMGRIEHAAEPDIPAILAGGALPRLARADEVAQAAAFLCSAAASFVTGCDLQVDGGQIAAHLERLASLQAAATDPVGSSR